MKSFGKEDRKRERIEKEEVIKRWEEYIEELFDHERGIKPTRKDEDYGEDILKSEVEFALRKMKRGKAPGPDQVNVEMLDSAGELGLEKLNELINKVYNTGNIPGDLSKSMFIAIPNKPKANECELHRTISLMSHTTKILLRILMKRARTQIKPEISNSQCGFVQGKGTRNAICMMRTLIERSIEMKQDIYVCMIDYSKAFDKVQHEPFMEILRDLKIEGKSWRLIRNIYWDRSATIRYENELGTWESIRRGLRQGCIFSPDGFSIYSERIMKKIEDMPGATVGGVNISNLRFADDTALIANTEKDLQELVNKMKEESKLYGLSLNKKKTYTMVFSKKKEISKCSIKIDGVELEQVKQFNYLGSILTSDGRSKVEIDRRIGQAKSAFGNMTDILSNKKISIQTRLRT